MNPKTLLTALLAALACAAWLGASVASATTVTSPAGTVYTSGIAAESEGHIVLDPPFLPAIECFSQLEGKVEAHGTEVPVGAAVSSLSFSACTNSWHATTVKGGTLSIDTSGNVTSTGMTVEATRLGITCRYATSTTAVGVLTSSSETSVDATVHVQGSIPFHSGSGLCGVAAAEWEGSYEITTPSPLYVVGATILKTVTQNGAGVNECKFTKKGEKCQIKLTVDGKDGEYRIERGDWKATGEKEKAEVRYKVTEGCAANTVLKDKESCTDEIEVQNIEAGTENHWCVMAESVGVFEGLAFCTKLSM